MTLAPEIVVVVLVAAALHAGWNSLVKIGGDRLVVMAVVNGVGSLFMLFVLPVVGVPDPASWPFLAASVAVHTGYYFFLIEAYREGDLSQVYPLARGVSPLLVALGAAVFADEVPSARAAVGIVVVCAGIAAIACHRGRPRAGAVRPLLFALGTGCLIAAYTVIDGMGVRRSGSIFAYIAWLFLLDGIPVAAVAIAVRKRELAAVLRREAGRSVAGGCMQLLAYGLVIWAMSRAPMAAVSTLRETSVIFAALIGAVWLREGVGAVRVSAAVVVAAGLIIMRG